MDKLRRKVEQPSESDEEKPDPKKELRETVNLILPDSLMIALAVIMIPVVLVPLFVNLPNSIDASFRFIDYAILGVFIIEYLSKLVLAPNIVKHFLNPWHLLDLLIVIMPVINFLPFVSGQLGVSSPMLRLLRIIRIFAVGGRTLDRRAHLTSSAPAAESVLAPLSIHVMDGKLANNYEDVPIDQLKKYLDDPAHTWVNISSVSESDLDWISTVLSIPRILLESELKEESYPRADYFEHYSMIFARIADMQVSHKGPARLLITRTGLLVICHGQNIITVSRSKNDLFHQVIEEAKKVHSPDEPIVVTILYTIMKHILGKDKQIIRALEQELIFLESIPPKKRPSNFLETTFHLRKEANELVPSLLHLKEIISVITSERVPLEGFSERHEKIFGILADDATYLHETASNARDDLQSLVDLYINTTSFETNKVMRIIAIITSLSIIPATMGLLGSNIIGNPWDIQLWQVFSILGVLMLAMGWIFYRLGWLKG
jgi:Mg2+ and Co2+ transporter CorA